MTEALAATLATTPIDSLSNSVHARLAVLLWRDRKASDRVVTAVSAAALGGRRQGAIVITRGPVAVDPSAVSSAQLCPGSGRAATLEVVA